MSNIEAPSLQDSGGGVDSERGAPTVAVIEAELVTNVPVGRGWWRWIWNLVGSFVEWMFGLASLIVGLSILATLPLLQFMSLGYLLEASGRVIRSGRIRDGFIGVRKTGRVGSVAAGVFLTLLPVRLFSSLSYSSYLLNGDSAQTKFLRGIVLVFGVLALWHIGWATFRGGKLRHFLWPAPLKFLRRLKAGGMYDDAATRLWEFFRGLRLPYYFWMGLRGFLGALIWLLIPVTLMAFSSRIQPPGLGGLCAFVGGVLLSIVLLYLPFLQARLPATNRFGSQFNLRLVRKQFRRAPIAYWFSPLMTLALAIPLYLLKAELIPREAAWLPSLFFVAFMFPARILVGWAVSRSERRDRNRLWLSRWGARLATLPVVLIYALLVYFTQFTSWYGAWSLYEQHAFLVPVPFLGF